jgi:hypothetical protein
MGNDRIAIADHLRRVLSAYYEYHNQSRMHLSPDKDCPERYSRPLQVLSLAFPKFGGLHHRYESRSQNRFR